MFPLHCLPTIPRAGTPTQQQSSPSPSHGFQHQPLPVHLQEPRLDPFQPLAKSSCRGGRHLGHWCCPLDHRSVGSPTAPFGLVLCSVRHPMGVSPPRLCPCLTSETRHRRSSQHIRLACSRDCPCSAILARPRLACRPRPAAMRPARSGMPPLASTAAPLAEPPSPPMSTGNRPCLGSRPMDRSWQAAKRI